jgi:hypothetical protein
VRSDHGIPGVYGARYAKGVGFCLEALNLVCSCECIEIKTVPTWSISLPMSVFRVSCDI